MKKQVLLVITIILVSFVIAEDSELRIGSIGDAELIQGNIFADSEIGIFLTESICGNGFCDTGESCSSCSGDCGICPGISRGGKGIGVECTNDRNCASNEACIKNKCAAVECKISNDCKENQYCLGYKCYGYECITNADCRIKDGEVCKDHRCIKLFDIIIKKFESPVKVGNFFEFTYLVKGMANISDDIKINFWIEKEGTVITSGHDTIFISSFEEKTMTAELFLPSTIKSDIYSFFVQLEYGDYKVDSHRTIEIIVDEAEGTALIIEREKFLEIDFKIILIGVLVGLAVIIVVLIIYFKKIKISFLKR